MRGNKNKEEKITVSCFMTSPFPFPLSRSRAAARDNSERQTILQRKGAWGRGGEGGGEKGEGEGYMLQLRGCLQGFPAPQEEWSSVKLRLTLARPHAPLRSFQCFPLINLK
ncbi:hypothetical protein E2C01_101736 [Portunus trituberculatus]|uniref:Uncharacterized protein n=1 Tax=Portunus trituberculatus TaxID=210409 RepID=A0A5B7KAJ5_PORTR|nr:hypothetical protein [Portunus trituberculatus]